MLFCGVPTNNDEGTVKKNKKLFYITSGPVWQAGRQGSLKTSESGPGTNCCCKNQKLLTHFVLISKMITRTRILSTRLNLVKKRSRLHLSLNNCLTHNEGPRLEENSQ